MINEMERAIKTNKIIQGDTLQVLRTLPSESVDMQITSPPYWGLRDYGKEVERVWDAKGGCKHKFKEIKENGKGYSKGSKTRWQHGATRGNQPENWDKQVKKYAFCQKCGAWRGQLGLEPNFNLYLKHLLDIFDEVKRVLKKDGVCWVNLGDTYSGGGNPNDRFQKMGISKSTGNWKDKSNIQPKCLCGIPERFMLGMIERGWILRNKIIWRKPNHMPSSVKDRFANSWEYLFMFVKSKKYHFDLDAVREPFKTSTFERAKGKFYSKKSETGNYAISNRSTKQFAYKLLSGKLKGKNPGDVIESDFWNIPTQPFRGAHFAVFPEKLVERPIKVTRKDAVIMDIFMGSGTTALVALKNNRRFLGIELKKQYICIAMNRIKPFLERLKEARNETQISA